MNRYRVFAYGRGATFSHTFYARTRTSAAQYGRERFRILTGEFPTVVQVSDLGPAMPAIADR